MVVKQWINTDVIAFNVSKDAETSKENALKYENLFDLIRNISFIFKKINFFIEFMNLYSIFIKISQL